MTIEANKVSYLKNNTVTHRGNKRYMQGVGLTSIAILMAIILLLISTFMAIEKVPTKVQVVNVSVKPIQAMSKDTLLKTIIIPIPKK